MVFTVDFGAAQSGVGYQFYNSSALIGSRVTSGITNPRTGVYAATATPGSGAIGIYWDCADANFTAIEDLSQRIADEAGYGLGAYSVTVTVTDGAAALQNATVRLTEGANNYVALTNASGVATFALDAATYTIAITKDGYSFTPTTIVVAAAGNFANVMTAITSPSAPADPSQSTGTLVTRDAQGNAQGTVDVWFELLSAPGNDSYKTAPFKLTSNNLGVLQAAFRRLANYRGRREYVAAGASVKAVSPWVSFTVPDSGTFSLPQILGTA